MTYEVIPFSRREKVQEEGEVLSLQTILMPLTLSTDAFRKASNFMKVIARPLERALFAHEFEDGPEQAVIDALAEFQNDDGGFGHGIEPDIWMPESSPLSTTVALQHLSALALPADHRLVSGAIAYLIDSYDAERAGWSKVSWEVKDAPHAPQTGGIQRPKSSGIFTNTSHSSRANFSTRQPISALRISQNSRPRSRCTSCCATCVCLSEWVVIVPRQRTIA